MSKFQKFMFDNFVIPTPAEQEKEEEPAAEVEAVETEVVTEVPQEDEVHFFQQEEQVEELWPFSAKEETEVELSPTPSYSEEEFEAAVEKARQEGYEQGKSEACGEYEKSLVAVMNNLEADVVRLIAASDEMETENEQKLLFLCRDILQKILPGLEEKYAIETVKKFLKENFAVVTASKKLAFYFNPGIIKQVRETIANLAESHDFEGKISLHKDEELSLSDCRIEWENGGVERSRNKIIDKISELLNDNAITPDTEKNDGK